MTWQGRSPKSASNPKGSWKCFDCGTQTWNSVQQCRGCGKQKNPKAALRAASTGVAPPKALATPGGGAPPKKAQGSLIGNATPKTAASSATPSSLTSQQAGSAQQGQPQQMQAGAVAVAHTTTEEKKQELNNAILVQTQVLESYKDKPGFEEKAQAAEQELKGPQRNTSGI